MRILVFSWLLLMLSLFQILSVSRVLGQCLDDQRSLLLQLRNGLVFNSSSSTKLVDWNQKNVDCCNWNGVACDSSGHVISLELDHESIIGGIENSSSLFSFQYLQKLNLAYNSFGSVQIPTGFGNLTQLTHLNLSNAGLGGQIPVELSKMKSLISLDLSSQFQGVLPLKLENPNLQMLVQNLTGLGELYLDGVNISSQGGDWWQALSSSLPNLRNLSLRNCDLSGALSPSISQLQSLTVLRLDRNNLSTTVPDFFANFRNLTVLTLGFCSLQGSFPEMIFRVPTLQYLDLSNNGLLSGNIPEFLVSGSLRTIVLSYTNFSGSLPESVNNLHMLSMLDLSNCNFTGPIPLTIANLTELVHLDFSVNFFSGSIPVFRNSNKLKYIDFSHNGLNGSLSPTHFEGLSSLSYLNLGNNLLSGSIPQSLFSLPALQRLQLFNNKFSGQVNQFPTLNASSLLDTLDLSSNRLEGSIPESFFNLEKLNVLSLSSNFFNGTLQLEKIRSLQNLTRLDLAYNNLSVVVSSSNSESFQLPQLSRLNLAFCNLSTFPNLRNQTRLTFLDLSNNKLTGEIPSWIWNIGNGAMNLLNLSCNSLVDLQKPYNIPSGLSVLDLHANKLSGKFPVPPESAIYVDYSSNNFEEIPVDFGNFTSFALFFSLANNSLTGTIPTSLCSAVYLEVLDLSSNFLSGGIPPCLLQNIEALKVLNLGRNNISGHIPDNFVVNCGLETLDLSTNNLEGKIPTSLANCKLLQVLNVGNNNIDDRFPCMLKNSSSLQVLVLRSNKFYGDIMCDGVNHGWPNLQIIDIAFNRFTGYIEPMCISSWRGMAFNHNARFSRSHLHVLFLDLNKYYYQDTVIVTMKGLEVELLKILTVFTSIDFSGNNFRGEIPDAIGQLSSLYVLNLSHNSFSGTIPGSIGNLTQLGSLDLSVNKLTGEIPEVLTSLTFLSFLNLSYNKLVGMIPQGSQLQTFSASSYYGNTELCGFPLNITCNFNQPERNLAPTSSRIAFDWQFIFTGLGFGVGAALIMTPLVFCKKWREHGDVHLDQFLKLIYPKYGFNYVMYDGKVEAIENAEDETTDEDEDDDGRVDEVSRGRYCVFCTKLDIQIKKAVHSFKCTCHYSPPAFSSSPVSSSSSSLLVVYNQNF